MLAIELLAGRAAESAEWAGLPRIESALLIGTTLRFADAAGLAGWPPRVLARMRRRLAQAPEETLLAFLGQLDAGLASHPGKPSLAEKLWRQLGPAPGFTPAGLDAGLACCRRRIWPRSGRASPRSRRQSGRACCGCMARTIACARGPRWTGRSIIRFGAPNRRNPGRGACAVPVASGGLARGGERVV